MYLKQIHYFPGEVMSDQFAPVQNTELASVSYTHIYGEFGSSQKFLSGP